MDDHPVKIFSSPLVSVVVASFNQKELLCRCLESVFQQEYRPIEVIVVDNGSNEDIVDTVTAEFPDCRVLRNEVNLGFAGGYNRGIQNAAGEYVAILNNDAIVSPQWLSSLVAAAQMDDSIGAVGSIILDGNRPRVLDSCGVGISFDGMSRQAMKGRVPPVLSGPRDVLLVSGCACLFRMRALGEIGLFDEDFFAYCEDTDLGLRLRWAGWRAVVVPGCEVIHYYSMTTGKFSLDKLFWVERNHVWVAVKNFPLLLLSLFVFVTIWRYFVQLYAGMFGSEELREFRKKKGLSAVIATVVRANIAAFQGIPRMMNKRKSFAAKRRISSSKMMKLLMTFRLPLLEIVKGG
jgi:GT2 family glycosyltransferase